MLPDDSLKHRQTCHNRNVHYVVYYVAILNIHSTASSGTPARKLTSKFTFYVGSPTLVARCREPRGLTQDDPRSVSFTVTHMLVLGATPLPCSVSGRLASQRAVPVRPAGPLATPAAARRESSRARWTSRTGSFQCRMHAPSTADAWTCAPPAESSSPWRSRRTP